jgi:hypothetical protein
MPDAETARYDRQTSLLKKGSDANVRKKTRIPVLIDFNLSGKALFVWNACYAASGTNASESVRTSPAHWEKSEPHLRSRFHGKKRDSSD